MQRSLQKLNQLLLHQIKQSLLLKVPRKKVQQVVQVRKQLAQLRRKQQPRKLLVIAHRKKIKQIKQRLKKINIGAMKAEMCIMQEMTKTNMDIIIHGTMHGKLVKST